MEKNIDEVMGRESCGDKFLFRELFLHILSLSISFSLLSLHVALFVRGPEGREGAERPSFHRFRTRRLLAAECGTQRALIQSAGRQRLVDKGGSLHCCEVDRGINGGLSFLLREKSRDIDLYPLIPKIFHREGP